MQRRKMNARAQSLQSTRRVPRARAFPRACACVWFAFLHSGRFMAAALGDRHELLPLLVRPPNEVDFANLSTAQLVSLYEALALSPSNLEAVLAAAEHSGMAIMNYVHLYGQATIGAQAVNHAQHEAICSNTAFFGAATSAFSQFVSLASAQPPAMRGHAWDTLTSILNCLLAGIYGRMRADHEPALSNDALRPLFSMSNLSALAGALKELEPQVYSVDTADMDDDDMGSIVTNMVGSLAQMHTLLQTAAEGGDGIQAGDGLLSASQLRPIHRAVDYAEQRLGVHVPTMDAVEMKRWHTTNSHKLCPTRCGCPSCTATTTTHNLLRCGQCKLVFYCSREHQRADWPRHRLLCQAARLAGEAPRPAPTSPNPAAFHAAGSGDVHVARAFRVIMTGFEGVGKSTILSDLELGAIQQVPSRAGMALEMCEDTTRSLTWLCFDLADGEQALASEKELRSMLCRRNGLPPTVRALVFVVDACRPEDFGRAKERLARLLAQKWAAPHIPSRRPPLVILAHKDDEEDTYTAEEVSRALGVYEAVFCDRPVLCTSSMRAAAGGRPGLESVVAWIEAQTSSWDSVAI